MEAERENISKIREKNPEEMLEPEVAREKETLAHMIGQVQEKLVELIRRHKRHGRRDTERRRHQLRCKTSIMIIQISWRDGKEMQQRSS